MDQLRDHRLRLDGEKTFPRIAVTPPPPSIKVHFDENDVIFDL